MKSHGFPPTLRRLVNELTKLPSVGEKSAIRLAYHLITNEPRMAFDLADAIRRAREEVELCATCFFFMDRSGCIMCQDASRLRNTLCVVEKPSDVLALERSGGYRGLYHVLHGLWSPLKGIAPERIKIPELIRRVDELAKTGLEEVVLATSTTVEGDATALYVANALNPSNVRVTRIAQGIPKGGELDYADEMTLSHAMQGRRQL